MIRNDTRESAHLKSRVKDLSVVPNLVSFTGLFTAITPIAKLETNPETGLYDPILIRDTDSLIANFGDPRIDPEKYIDLYSIMQVVGNGTSCYVAKVSSGEAGIYELAFVPEDNVIASDKVETDINTLTNNDGHQVTWTTPQEDEHVGECTVPNLSNQYVVTKLIAHKNSSSSGGYSATWEDSEGHTLTATLKDNVTLGDGDHISVSIVEDTDGEGYFNVEVTGTINGSTVDRSNRTNSIASYNVDSDNLYLILEGDTLFECGSQELTQSVTPARDWELDPNLYHTEYEDSGDTWVLHITVTDTDEPDTVVIKSATLDPEYGRESITLALHESTGSDDPYNGKTVWDCSELARKYTIMKIIAGDPAKEIPSEQYTVEWESANGLYNLHVIFSDGTVSNPTVEEAARQSKSVVAYSSMSDDLDITCNMSQARPYSLKLFYLNVEARSNGNLLGTAKVKLEPTTTNQSLVNNINSSLGTYARFELVDPDTAQAAEKNDRRGDSIVYNLLNKYAPYDANNKRADLESNPQVTPLAAPSVLSQPNFHVNLQNYIDSQMLYKDHRYVGSLLADFTAPVTHDNNGKPLSGIKPLDPEERRALHYNLKQIACERKDSTVILSTPYFKSYDDPTPFMLDEVCNWVASQGDFVDLWEYGAGNTTDYSIQSFYLEIYYSWLNLQCTKIENGLAKSVKVKVAPANLVVDNVLRSWRERGVQYPVAGDQYGTLTDQATILQNPKTKLERDQLVQYRINPIWDTGTRGIQIYGNETLNAGYTDLNAAHIARTLVYIRSRIDEYTETLKFLINSQILWDTWKNYVSSRILAPLQAAEALSSYRVTMGEETTSREEIANRIVKGNVELTFYQAAEIFDLSFIVYSSATTVEEANPL